MNTRWIERPYAPLAVVLGIVVGFLVGMPFVLLFLRWWWRIVLCNWGGMTCAISGDRPPTSIEQTTATAGDKKKPQQAPGPEVADTQDSDGRAGRTL